MILAVFCVQVPLAVQVFASTVVVVAAVLSRRVAVAQSYVTVSGQTLRYQKVSLVLPAGAVKVCCSVLSPLVGVVVPRRAAQAPECAPALTAVALGPEAVQPA